MVADKLQINIEYDAPQDRLLMRVSEKESHGDCIEYRLWLTRRFVGVFIRAADKLVEDALAADMQVSPDAMAAMKNFQRDAALAKADFSTAYEADVKNCTIVGETPLLITTLKVRKKSKERYAFSLVSAENEGLNINAGIDLVHTLRKMLVSTVEKAGWNQPVSIAGGGKKGGESKKLAS